MPLEPYLENNFSHTKKSITDLSSNDQGKALVKHTKCMYCFDNITTHFHGTETCPTSSDALMIANDIIYLVEFKGGFKRKITKENFDDAKAACAHNNNLLCQHFKDFIFKNADQEREILKDSLKMKALESYTTLEKFLFSDSQLDRETVQVHLICVTDMPADDLMTPSTDTESDIKNLENALSRFKNKTGSDGKKYLYDEIQVLSPNTFEQLIKAGHIPALP